MSAEEGRRDGAASAPGGLPPIVELSAEECAEVLRRQRMCVLSVVDGGAPYAVPVYYGWDGHALHLGVAEGRKTRALDADPRVCVVVTETGPGDDWRSVVVVGRVRALTAPEERARGVEVLVAHNRRPERGSAAPAARRSGGRILRVEGATVTGRARTGSGEATRPPM